MLLTDIITDRIKKEGPISFHDFMEMALYYPQLGYYTSLHDHIGANGDFYTSSSLTHLFGVMIGKQIEEMWSVMGEEPFTIVEYGAGTGFLCHDILNYLKDNERLYACLHYCIIEKSPVMRAKEKAHLKEKVSWYSSVHEVPTAVSCILSNELIDNFAVHQVVMQDDLMEVFVDYENDFFEVLKPASQAIKDYLKELDINLSRGFRTEINLESIEWIKEVASVLKKGFVMTIDYGYPSLELYREYRSQGTLVCYNKHKINTHPYKDIGHQDITSHVNFSALYHWGLKNNLDCCGFTSQAHFLLSLGFKSELLNPLSPNDDSYSNYKKNALMMHELLVEMGNKFKVLIQQKGMPMTQLSGLKFSTVNEIAVQNTRKTEQAEPAFEESSQPIVL